MPRQNKGPYLKLDKETGNWNVHWTEPGGQGRRVSTRTRDRTEATRYLANFILEGQQAHEELKKQEARDGELKINTVLDWYESGHVNSSLSDVVDDGRKTLRIHLRWLRPHFGPLSLSQLDNAAIESYIEKRKEGKASGEVRKGKHGERPAKSAGTMRRELGTLIAAFGWAVDNRKMQAVHVPPIAMPQQPAAKDFWLRETETPQLMDAAIAYGNLRGRLFIAIAMHTASRKAAVQELQWDQVDFDAMCDDEGTTMGLIHFNPRGRSQTIKRRMAIPICPELRAELELVPVADRHGYVVPRPKDGRVRTRADITSVYNNIKKHAAKVYNNPRFLESTPHTMRHTWATQAARADQPMEKIAAFLGDDLKTVIKNYIHHSPSYLKSIASFRSDGKKKKLAAGLTPSIADVERLLARLKADAGVTAGTHA